MLAYLAHRLWILVATLLVVSALVFGVLDVLPGHAAQVLMGTDADPEAVAALAAQLGLEAPAWQRYTDWLAALLRADLGESYV